MVRASVNAYPFTLRVTSNRLRSRPNVTIVHLKNWRCKPTVTCSENLATRFVDDLMKILLVVVLLTGVAGAYIYLHPEETRSWREGTPLAPKPTKTRLYKWQDNQGHWHITDQPPPAQGSYQTLEYRSDVNILPLPPGLQEDH